MMERTAAESAAMAEELRNVLRQAEKLVSALSEDRAEAVVELRQRVSAAIAEGRQRLSEIEARARLLKNSARDAVDVYVRENPWTSVGVGAALGIVLGAWLASPSSPPPVEYDDDEVDNV